MEMYPHFFHSIPFHFQKCWLHSLNRLYTCNGVMTVQHEKHLLFNSGSSLHADPFACNIPPSPSFTHSDLIQKSFPQRNFPVLPSWPHHHHHQTRTESHTDALQHSTLFINGLTTVHIDNSYLPLQTRILRKLRPFLVR